MTARTFKLPFALLALALTATPRLAAAKPAPGEVTLGLAQYLALVEAAEARERARLAVVESPSSWIARQESRLVLEGDGARLTTRFEIEARGSVPPPVLLPWPILAETASFEPATGASLTRLANGASALVATQPGTWRVIVEGDAPSQEQLGLRRFELPLAKAPFATVEVELAADQRWSAPGAVVTADAVDAGRRRLELAPPRGIPGVFEVSRRSAASAPETALVRSMVVTLVELGSDSARRHDVVLYEVLRGQLGRLEVDVPAGRTIDLVATDEGDAVPVATAAGHLVVERKRQLAGEGYLVLTSTETLPRGSASLRLDPIVPTAEVKARYLVLAAGLAAEVAPEPEAAWQQIDLSDLPSGLRQRVGEVEPAAVWRLSGAATAPALAVHPLPAADLSRGLVRARETTSLLSLDGTLLHRERLLVATGAPAVAFTLPAGATFWSAQVDGKTVRPVERDGRLLVPLPARAEGARSEVEMISVQPKKLERARRSRLGLELAEVDLPVLNHRWRLLLPGGYRYRVAGGDLPAVPASALAAPLPRPVGAASDRAYGPVGSSTLRVRMTDQGGSPLPGVTVTLQGSRGPGLVGGSDAQGWLSFERIAPGSYALLAQLEGFSSVEYPKISLKDERVTTVEVQLTPAVEEVITVTSEAPLIDQRRIVASGTVSQVELEKIPTARDPWVLLQQAPVLVDRANVGGNESGQQSVYVSPGGSVLVDHANIERSLAKGVQPLPIRIPDTGRVIDLAGALPPGKVALELEVKTVR